MRPGKFFERLEKKREEGAVLVTAIILLTLMELLGFALITMSEIDNSVAGNLARNEEAYYAAEQGVFIGINWTIANYQTLLGGGSPQIINSSMFQGKSRDYSWGQDAWPYLRWESEITLLGKTAPYPGVPLDIEFYRYRIISSGQSTGKIIRRIQAEFVVIGEPTGEGKLALAK